MKKYISSKNPHYKKVRLLTFHLAEQLSDIEDKIIRKLYKSKSFKDFDDSIIV